MGRWGHEDVIKRGDAKGGTLGGGGSGERNDEVETPEKKLGLAPDGV